MCALVAEVTRMPCDSIAMFLDDECSSARLGCGFEKQPQLAVTISPGQLPM